MKKYIYFLVLFPMSVFGQVYSPFSQNISVSELINNTAPIYYDPNTGNVSINNDVLTISFQGVWSNQEMKTGVIKYLAASENLPDIELGEIMDPDGHSGLGYYARIVNNVLEIYTLGQNKPIVGGCSFNFSQTICPTVWYLDGDGDGFGTNAITKISCTQPINYVTDNTDCNDGNALIKPNTIWYADNDLDGLGDPLNSLTQCTQPTGNWVLDNTDNCPLLSGTSTDCSSLSVSLSQNQNYIKTTTYQIPYNGTTYSNYSYSNTALNLVTSDFINSTDGSTIGSMLINNNVLTVNLNGSWYPQQMKVGIIKTLAVSPSLPIIELGPILSSGAQTGYFAKIENNNLTVYSTFLLTWMSINTTTYVSGADGSSYSVNTGSPFPSTCSGGGSGTISKNGNLVTLNVSGSWSSTCNIKTGQIVQVPSTPNTDLGVINGQNGNTAYRAKIENNWLVFYSPQAIPAPPSSANISFTVDLGIAKHDQLENITYFDGLGRPIQQNAIKQSNSGKDIITHIEYDAFGRQTKEYLPYVRVGTDTGFDNYAKTNSMQYYANPTFATTGNPNFEATTNPFSEKQLEASPLNRVLQQAAPGNDWALPKISTDPDHTIKLDYQTNITGEVKLYLVALSSDGTYTPSLSLSTTNSGYYDANQLYKTITKDENWTSTTRTNDKDNTTEEFKDKEGRVVLKRTYSDYIDAQGVVTATEVAHDTYYVYDDYGNLTYVIPPKADGTITQAVLDDLCYQYKYDYRNRLVEKKLPGKQWEFIVYDKLDRVVATGPAFSPFSDFVSPNNLGWMVTKYDAFSRPVLTAWSPAATVTSAERQALQNVINTETVIYETKTSTNTTINGVAFRYTDAVWPTKLSTPLLPATIYHILTVNYYDDYSFPNMLATIPAMVLGQPVFYNNTTKPKGLPTGSWTRVLETSALYKNELAYTLYDHKARPIRNYTTNFLGGSNQIETYLDFSGKTLYTVTTHKRLSNSAAITVREDFTYSDQNRLMTHTHSVNGATPAQLLASNTYDELGQLISKNVGNTAVAPLQKVDYSYNIRGWMTGINNVDVLQQGADPKDLFAFKINYNTASIAGINPLYNGNIAETYWNSASDPLAPVRAYGYQYDNLNRLKNAIYQKSGAINNGYNESLTYDKNGNIKTLWRNGNSEASTVLKDNMDHLVYTYGGGDTNNQLLKVDDSSDKTTGFIDITAPGNDYSYDVNGNMTSDANKNISSITYNHLSLPTKIIFATGSNTGNIVYLYNAAGQKVQKIVTKLTPTPAATTTTDYLGGFQYSGVSSVRPLQFFPTAEGYVEPNGSSYKYVYQYKDHLGNLRLSYGDKNNNGVITVSSDPNLNEVVEENNYYPFGLKQIGYNPNVMSSNPALKYKYNGKELQDELNLNVYDYQARNYDPALGRWMNVDPLAQKMPGVSPYAFCLNNPINMFDPDGKYPYPVFIRSFIATGTVAGGTFRGDGRSASTSTTGVTSRVTQSYVVDSQKGTVTNKFTRSDATVAYAYPGGAGPNGIGPKVDVAKPTQSYSATNSKNSMGDNITTVSSNYTAKDPITPQALTPQIDMHPIISISENSKTGTVSVSASISGDSYPSTEAFMQDASGKNGVFIGVSMEQGGLLDLAGDNKNTLINTSFQITTDGKGNFTGVQQGDKTYTIGDWNKQFTKKE